MNKLHYESPHTTLKPMDRVIVVTDPAHTGRIERFSGDGMMAWVRWHRGYATWEELHMLRRAVG
jgi:hypothetical protein